MDEKQTSKIEQKKLFKVIDAVIGYLKLIIAMLEELRENNDFKKSIQK